MRRGPKPKPSIIRDLEGNQGKKRRNRSEPEFPPADPMSPPEWLNVVAREEWLRVAPVLGKVGLLTVVDVTALAAYCACYSRYREAEEVLEQLGTTFTVRDDKGVIKGRWPMPEVGIAVKMLDKVRALAGEFGFTPSARGRIELDKLGVNDVGEMEQDELERERERIARLLEETPARNRKGVVQ